MKGIFLIFKSEPEKKKYEYFINRLKSVSFSPVIQLDPESGFDVRIIVGTKK